MVLFIAISYLIVLVVGSIASFDLIINVTKKLDDGLNLGVLGVLLAPFIIYYALIIQSNEFSSIMTTAYVVSTVFLLLALIEAYKYFFDEQVINKSYYIAIPGILLCISQMAIYSLIIYNSLR